MNPLFLVWIRSVAAAFIGGGATAVSSTLGLTLAAASGVDVPVLNFKACGVIFLASGLVHVCAYLQKSPLPGVDRDTAAPAVAPIQAAAAPAPAVQTPGKPPLALFIAAAFLGFALTACTTARSDYRHFADTTDRRYTAAGATDGKESRVELSASFSPHDSPR